MKNPQRKKENIFNSQKVILINSEVLRNCLLPEFQNQLFWLKVLISGVFLVTYVELCYSKVITESSVIKHEKLFQ